uniref:WD repeat domain 90 n=1 Tax=Stegastes partitus TaxID=144197 RepID=A0A3B4ZWV6_9TELE
WQHPYVNIFKHVRVEDWRKSTKEGDVSSYTDKKLKSPVYRIRGPVPANSYILVPKNINQSLGLTGRFFYLLFRPTPGKYFVVHLDVAAEQEGQVIRISFSNMFKEFKSTATWLQFPFLCGAAKDSVYESTSKSARHLVGPAPTSVRWTCLMLDLQHTLSVYLKRCYSHLKSVKLCANMAVKNMFTTDLLLDPMPREMSFPVPKGGSWHDLYDYIFPSEGTKLPFDSIQKGSPQPETRSPVRERPRCIDLSKAVQDRVSLIQQITTPKLQSCDTDDGGVHVYVHPDDGLSNHGEESEEEKLLPDPILRLSRIIGFGGATTKCVLWTKSGDAVVYPCHAIIVSMKISSNQQRFFIGHTDKVSALAFNGNTTLLASAQTGNNSVVRVWNYHKGNCLAMFRIHAHSLSCLFSHGGGILCGVGKDSHNKTMVVVWNTLNVSKRGEVTVLAKAHTDVDIHTMKVTFFDDTMVSCGRDNIRLWRVRNGMLRSCPVNLGEYHSMDFTDVAFEEGSSSDQHLDDRTFVSSRSGHIFEIDYSRVVIRNVRRLLPAQQQHAEHREKWTFNTPGIAINSISVSSSFCATGSEDGFLRLWPHDFSAVFLEAHEGPVSVVSASFDSLQVLAATSTGNLGFLDVSSRGYNTLMRSHTDTVLGFSVDGVHRHLTTASSDGTVRIWNMDSLHQLYDFVSEDSPCSVAFHPSEQTFCCGFTSGIVRVFDISSAKLLAEHQHRGEVVGLAFSADGEFMYSADSQGSLALYNSSEEDHNVIKVANVVARGTERAPDALSVSSDSRCLAFVGPSEYIVTIADARSLDEVLHVDVSILDVESPRLDSALKVCFSPASIEHLLVATSANKILWVSTKTGRLLREVSKVHKHQCSSLAVSEDSRFLLTAGHNAVKVWDYNMQLDTNSQMFIGHSQPIRQVSFTPDQLGVVSVGDAIFLWDFLSNGMPRQAAPLPSSPPDCYRHFIPRFKTSCLDQAVVAPQPQEEGIKLKAVIGYNGNGRGNMVWSPDQLFAYSCGCVVVVEYLDTGRQRHFQGHSEEISCLAVTNDAQTVASAAGGSNDSKSLICIWDVQKGICRNTISHHWGAVQCLAFSRDDRFFLSVRMKTPAEVGDVELTALCYHMDSLLFTGTNRGHVCVWDVNTQRCFMTWEADEGEIVALEQEVMLDGTIVSAAFDTTMDMGIVGTTAGTLWYISWAENSNIRLVSGHKTKVNDVVFSFDESHFATCSEDGSVRVWSTSSYELVVQFQVLNQACGCVCWSPSSSKDSTCVAAGYSDGTLRIFRLASTEMELRLHPHQVAVTAIQYSANGLVAVSSPVNGATIRVIRDHKGAMITTIQCVNEQCKNFGLEGNEMWLAASVDRRVSVWAADWLRDKCDLLDWLTFPADSLPPSLAAFCPADYSLVVYTGYGVEKELCYYSLTKKQLQIIKKIALPHWPTCISLSSKSELVAVGSNRVLKLIQSTSGRFQDFLQHSDSLQTCHFSPSGTLLFSVAYNEILLWEVKGL